MSLFLWWRWRKKNGTRKNRDHAVPISYSFRFSSVICRPYLFEKLAFTIKTEIRLLWNRKRNEVRKPLHARFSPLAGTPKPPSNGPYSLSKPLLRSNVPFFFRQVSPKFLLPKMTLFEAREFSVIPYLRPYIAVPYHGIISVDILTTPSHLCAPIDGFAKLPKIGDCGFPLYLQL